MSFTTDLTFMHSYTCSVGMGACGIIKFVVAKLFSQGIHA